VLGGLGWAFCDYLDFFLGYPQSATAAPFPLLLLGLRRMVARPASARSPSRSSPSSPSRPPGIPRPSCTRWRPPASTSSSSSPGRPQAPSPRPGAAARRGVRAGSSAVQLLPLMEALPHSVEHPARKAWYAHQPRPRPWARACCGSCRRRFRTPSASPATGTRSPVTRHGVRGAAVPVRGDGTLARGRGDGSPSSSAWRVSRWRRVPSPRRPSPGCRSSTSR
jgi:hypothetical protein